MSLDIHLKVAACLWVFVSANSEASDPVRIVSADLCADIYVIALAAPRTIAALSWQAGQTVSAAPDWALELPRVNGDAERLISLNPDMVIFGPGGPGEAARFLDLAGIDYMSVQWGETFQSVGANLEAIGRRLGRETTADVLRNDLVARQRDLQRRAETRNRTPDVFYLSATGGAAGAGTLVDEAIRLAGGRNAAAEAGATGWLAADAEWAFRVSPDLIVTSYFVDGYFTRSDIGRRHSAFRHLLDSAPRIDVPASAWSCAGPNLIDAAEQIAEALDDLEGGS
ncbi:MAG: ABC transporter substrate-binding protein [Hyphobacterium sp.]|nr:MAG: ABC transporter substrate-binding protein [Hyphobacterium sp.]